MSTPRSASRALAGIAILAGILGFPAKPSPEPRPPRPASTVTFREQVLDTEIPEAPKKPPPPKPTRPPPPPECTPTIMPPNTNRKVETPQDEDLPDWVPICGRLTVIESSDMAENLGLVPPGTTKASAEKISVAKLLEQEAAERAAPPPPPSTGWTFIPGETFVDAR